MSPRFSKNSRITLSLMLVFINLLRSLSVIDAPHAQSMHAYLLVVVLSQTHRCARLYGHLNSRTANSVF